MNSNPIVAHFQQIKHQVKRIWSPRAVPHCDLHNAWLHPEHLPKSVQQSATAQRYLDLLGPLGWDRIPERNLQRNWGQATIPYAAFIPAILAKLNEGQESIGDLLLFLSEHPEIAWLFGFPGALSNPSRVDPRVPTPLPTTRHMTHLLRTIPQSVLQFLLADSVDLIRKALAAEGLQTGQCISLDTKHILAWVKENNPKTYVEERFDKTKQPAGDPDCKLGCKRRHNRRKAASEPPLTPPTPTHNPVPAKDRSAGEFYWGYGSGVVVEKVSGWGEYVLAELTQTFDKGDTTYFFPLMAQTEQRFGFRPRIGTFDAAFDAFYVYAHFHRDQDPGAFAAVPFAEKGSCKGRKFHSDGCPLCAADFPMHLRCTYTDRTRTILEHQRATYVCPLLVPQPNGQTCPIAHKNWAKGGCTVDLPTSIGARLRYTLDREAQTYKNAYKQRTAVERINSQAKALGIERPYLRNGSAIANQNTLIYLLINLRLLQRIRNHLPDTD